MATSTDWHLLPPADRSRFPVELLLGRRVCISVFYCAANQFIVQRTLAAKNEWHARMGVVFTDYLKFLTAADHHCAGARWRRSCFPH